MVDEILMKYGNRVIGLDEYSDLEYEYPEVYAKLAIALFERWIKTSRDEYKEKAYNYLKRMCALGIETDKWFYWGLPFDWRETKRNDGFLITTCFCMQALMVWEDKQWETIIEKAKMWCLSLCAEGIDEIYYSPQLKQNIYNATAMACGTLLESKKMNEKEKRKIYRIIKHIIDKQKSNGYWNYSDDKCDVDILHQSYTVEGLIRSYSYIGENILKSEVKKSALAGIAFLCDQLKGNIDISERYLFRFSDDEDIKIKAKHMLLKGLKKTHIESRHLPMTRCWSYAGLVRALYYGQMSFGINYQKEIKVCLGKIFNNLFCKTYFSYRKNDKRNFIRHQAHMMEVLSYVCQ